MTPEEIQQARDDFETIRFMKSYALTPGLTELIQIGLRVVDPRPEDVERVASVLSVGNPKAWRLHQDEAREAIKAMAEGGE